MAGNLRGMPRKRKPQPEVVAPPPAQLAPRVVKAAKEKAKRNPYVIQPDPVQGMDPAERYETTKLVFRDLPPWCSTYGWDWKTIGEAVQGHAAGQFAASGELCDAVLGDGKVQAALGQRTTALLGLPIKFEQSDKGDPLLAAACVRLWREEWERIAPRSVLSELCRYGIVMGYGLCEIQWDTTRTPWIPKLKVWHPRNTWYHVVERQFYVFTQDGAKPITPGDGKWLLYAPHGAFRGWLHGAIRSVAPLWVLRQDSYKDWARYNERHGLPIILADVPYTTKAETKTRFVSALKHMGSEGVVLCTGNPDGTKTDIRLIEASDQSWGAFKGLIDQCNGEIKEAILWQDVVSEDTSKPADRAFSGARQSVLEFDESTLMADIREQLARPFAEFNFGNADLAPKTHYEVEPAEDAEAELRKLEAWSRTVVAMRAAKMQFDPNELAKRYKVKVPHVTVVEDLAPPGEYEKATTTVSDGEAVGTGAGAPQPGAV